MIKIKKIYHRVIAFLFVTCLLSYFAKQIQASETIPYDGSIGLYYYYAYVGESGDGVSSSTVDGERTDTLMEQASKNSPFVASYGGTTYSTPLGKWAVGEMPAYEVGKKLIIEQVPVPNGFEIAWNQKPYVVLGEEGIDDFQKPASVYQITVPLVKSGEKARFQESSPVFIDEDNWIYHSNGLISVHLDDFVQYYTGKPITPKVFVQQGTLPLREGIDYKVTYRNNIEISGNSKDEEAQVVVEGLGCLKGTIIRNFKIIKNTAATTKTAISKGLKSQTLKAKKKTISVKAGSLKKRTQTIKAVKITRGNTAKTKIT